MTETKQRPKEDAPPEPEQQPEPQPEIITDAEVVEPASALVERPSREVLMPLDPDQVVDGMEKYQQLLPRLLVESDYQEAERGKRFVKKSGWRKIARAFNLSVTVVSMRVERDATGAAVRAECVARAAAPNGQVSDGDGYCSIDERRFEEFREHREGRKAKSMKIENDLRTTATTRAKNRAISDLVGMGEVSAEEVDGGGGAAAGPPFGPEVNDETRSAASKALTYLLGPEAEGIWGQIKGVAGGYMPQLVASSIVAVARAKRELEDAIEDAVQDAHSAAGVADDAEPDSESA
jgi:hypothetical protein